MPTVKKQDFVEMEYTGRTKEDNAIFDTTQADVAKKEGVYDKSHDYSPVVICIGENNLLKAVEDQLVGKEAGREYIFEINTENGFGKKDARLLQMIPLNKFRQQNIQPVPGLQLNIDGIFGVVKTVSGGRCYVDFNHPLAGRDLVYNVKIKRIVEDSKEKLNSLLKLHLHIKDAEIEINEDAATIKPKQEVPKEAQEEFKKIAQRTIASIKNVDFVQNKL